MQKVCHKKPKLDHYTTLLSVIAQLCNKHPEHTHPLQKFIQQIDKNTEKRQTETAMKYLSYLNFELKIEKQGDHYTASVTRSPAGEVSRSFKLPFDEYELKYLILQIAWETLIWIPAFAGMTEKKNGVKRV